MIVILLCLIVFDEVVAVENGKASQWRETKLGNFSSAAIATDAEPCAKIGV